GRAAISSLPRNRRHAVGGSIPVPSSGAPLLIAGRKSRPHETADHHSVMSRLARVNYYSVTVHPAEVMMRMNLGCRAAAVIILTLTVAGANVATAGETLHFAV